MKPVSHLTLSTSPPKPTVKNSPGIALHRYRCRFLNRNIRRGLTVKELDSETGLYYYGARYLDPKTNRWLSGDPALGEYLPSAPVSDEARKRNQSLPGQGGVFNYVNLHVYHYAGNNPVKYVDPDGKKEKPAITGISGVLPLVGEVNTGNWVADSLIAGLGNVWNAVATVINIPIRNAGDLIIATDNLLTVIDDLIPDEFSLTGQGLREDLFVSGLFAGMNPGMVASAVQGGKVLATNAANVLKPPPTFSQIVSSAKSFSDIEKAFFETANKGAIDTYKLLAPYVNDGEKFNVIEAFWKACVNSD